MSRKYKEFQVAIIQMKDALTSLEGSTKEEEEDFKLYFYARLSTN